MRDRDRRAILERRALFVSCSLAALGCGPKPPTEVPGSAINVPEQAATEQPDPKPDEVPPERQPTVPSIGYEVPVGISDTARENYDRLYAAMRGAHQRLDRAEAALPNACDMKTPACDTALRSVAGELTELEGALRLVYFCPGKSEEAVQFSKVEAAHRKALSERQAALKKSIEQSLAAGGSKYSQWEALYDQVSSSKPQICLSFGCSDW